jgi:hypothetical protein
MSKIKVMLEEDVILDWIFEKSSNHAEAKKIVELCMCQDKVYGHVTTRTILNLLADYSEASWEKLRHVITNLEILTVCRKTLIKAFNEFGRQELGFGLQTKAAESEDLDFIITGNVEYFLGSTIRAVKPEEFLAMVREIGRELGIIKNREG